MRTLLLDDDNQLVRATFLLFVSTILLLAELEGCTVSYMRDHTIIRYFPQVTWDLPLAAAGNFDAITGARRALGCL